MSKKLKLTHEALRDFFSSLHTMLHAGHPLSDCVLLLAEEEKDRRVAALYTDIAQQLELGCPLAEALEKSQAFPAHTTGLINIGERVGMLEESIHSAATFHGNRHRLQKQAQEAVTYPLILVFLMITVVTVLLTRVIPVFEDVYASLGSSMTGAAGGVLALGRWLNDALPRIFAAVIALLSLGALIYIIPPFRTFTKRLFFSVFGDCGIMRSVNNAGFATALSMAINSGIPFEEGIAFAAKLMGDNHKAARRCEKCLALLENGTALDEALKQTGLLPPSACSMLKLGMRTGTADQSMIRIAERLTEESERRIADMVALIEPALVIITSVMTGFILLTVMLPLINIMKVI